MVTTVQAKDVPEAWFSQKKTSASAAHRRNIEKSSVPDDTEENTVLRKPCRRGPGRPKTQAATSVKMKGKKRGRRPTPSTTDIVQALSKTAVPNADELRMKREEDAQACGRTVRTVKKPIMTKNCKSNSPLESSGGKCYEEKEALSRLVVCRPTASPPKSSVLPVSTEENNLDCMEPVFSRRSGKEHATDDYHEASAPPKTVATTMEIGAGNLELDRNRDYEDIQRDRRGRLFSRCPSAFNEDSTERYRSREVNHENYRRDGRRYQSEISFVPELVLGSHRRNGEWRNESSGSRSPRRNYERTDGDHNYDRRLRGQSNKREYYRDYEFTSRSDVEKWKSGSFSGMESRQRRRRESLSPESNCRNWRSLTSRGGQQWSNRSRSSEQSRSPLRKTQTGSDYRGKEWAIFVSAEADINASPSRAMERKERRHNQKLRESQKMEREKNGKKPFYLTLNDEGKPYGPGKPAWIAEINKLAVGLDPSCTHVRKQTFDDVQTFKDRLNEKFDYSGTLNDDFLRGLMGRAVTKRRGEFISLIRRDAPPPNYINDDVWKRLEKLANSEQREQKSEQGRYANACRRTFGRTGSIGVNGVREKLWSRFGRSPDPDEILEEMQRDKGYGGATKKVLSASARKENNSGVLLLADEEMRSETIPKFSDQSSSDTSNQRSRVRRTTRKSIGRGREYDVHDMDDVTRRMDAGHQCYTVTDTKKMSTEEYIEKLKGEIERLEAQNAKVLSSKIVMQSQPVMSAAYESSE